MATGTTHSYNDREFLFRLQTLIIDGGTTVLRNIFDQQLGNVPFNVFLANEKTKINRLRGQKIITTSQYDQLYPQGGHLPNITDFDITLITCLLRNLPSLGLNTHYRWNYQPQPADLSTEADLIRLRGFRNEIAHIKSTAGVDKTTFETKWIDIEQVLLRLNNGPKPVSNFQQTIDIYKNSSLDPAEEQRVKTKFEEWRELEKALESEINLVKEDMKTAKGEMTQVKEDVKGVKSDNKDVRSDVDKVGQDMKTVKCEITLVKKEIKSVKNDNEGVGKDMKTVTNEITLVKEEVKSVKNDSEGVGKDIKTMKDEITLVKEHVKGVKSAFDEVESKVNRFEEDVQGLNRQAGTDVSCKQREEVKPSFFGSLLSRFKKWRVLKQERTDSDTGDNDNESDIAKKTKRFDQSSQSTSTATDDNRPKQSMENDPMAKCTGSGDKEQTKFDETRPGAEPSKVSKSQDSSDVPRAVEVVSLVDDLFPQKVTHHHDKCFFSGCCNVSKNEINRMSIMKYKFQHNWLEKNVSYCGRTGIWWATYVEGEGIFCLLCKKHDCFNPQNKSKIFNQEASSRFRLQALDDHVMTQQHKNAITTELLQRVSYFQKEIDEHDKVSDTVLLKVFRAIYWLVKEEIPNKKAESLLQLIEKLGLEEMKYFDHKSRPSLREMFLVLGEALECSILDKLKKAQHFGLLVDDVTDISVYEQMVTFIQFYDRVEEDVKVAFLSIDNLLEESDSANAQTITQMIVKTLTDFELDIGKLSSFVSDGASVMTGKKNGVAAKLKIMNPKLISIHCICHRLALACTDTLEDATYFKQVQLWLVQLWKLFDNSPKKLAVYFKVQTEIKSVLFTTDKSKNVATRRLKKACQTRWLSFNSSVQAILKEYPTVLQTLNKLQSSDSAALGLFVKIRSFRFVSAVYILADVLPHLDQLSKTFQLGTIGLCQVLPSIQYTNDKLDEITDSMSPVEKLCKDLETDGCLSMLELKPTDHDITGMKSLCKKYTEALKKNIEARLGDSLPILSSLAVIDATKVPSKTDTSFKSHGTNQMQVIAEHFELDQDELTTEWGKLKYDMLRWKSEESVKTPKECLQRLVRLNYFYPILSDLADIVLSLPVSNAWPERGASAVKRIKTRLRSSLKNDMLQVLMNVSINGPDVSSSECDEVCKASVKLWLSKKKRKKLPTGKISKSSVTVVKCFSEAEVQTDSVAESVISREEISDIIRSELLAYNKACSLEMIEADSQSDYDSEY